ncbi:glycosyltransferase family 2 protein [Fischerella sp. JS2]|uniref:glycosyltransferase family 2 protein n=1 Tax=Fischerella sp. JS2 TaxID=2597771 RepID=UPI0028E45415|nr:glycosyltransferase [Fischerella sp. JS2]
MPKVSVIIPAYNAMTYLPETLESVLRQTFTDFEVLIVNDGSSDPILEWACGIVDPRVKLISQENQGVSTARNTGITHAQGEYIAFVDADDLWESTKLAKQIRCLEENPAIGLVHTWIVLIDEQGKSSGRVISSNAKGNVWKQVVEHNLIQTSTVLVRRCCLETVGVFDQNLRSAEDWELWVRIASRYLLAVVKEPLVFYRLHSCNTTKNWRLIEQGLSPVIEKVFQSIPPEAQYLKHRCYGRGNLHLAWKALQSDDKDCKWARHFRTLAVKYYPQLRYSRQYIRLSLAIAIMEWFGPFGFSRVMAFMYILRHRVFSI